MVVETNFSVQLSTKLNNMLLRLWGLSQNADAVEVKMVDLGQNQIADTLTLERRGKWTCRLCRFG